MVAWDGVAGLEWHVTSFNGTALLNLLASAVAESLSMCRKGSYGIVHQRPRQKDERNITDQLGANTSGPFVVALANGFVPVCAPFATLAMCRHSYVAISWDVD